MTTHQLVPDESRSILAPEQPASLKSNLIVQGDNLHALKALMPSFSGKVKVIYIDLPSDSVARLAGLHVFSNHIKIRL